MGSALTLVGAGIELSLRITRMVSQRAPRTSGTGGVVSVAAGGGGEEKHTGVCPLHTLPRAAPPPVTC